MKPNQTQLDTITAIQKLAISNGESIPTNLFVLALSQNDQYQPNFSSLFRKTICERLLFEIANQLYKWQASNQTLGYILGSKHFGRLCSSLVSSYEKKQNGRNNREIHVNALDKGKSGCVKSRGSKPQSMGMNLDAVVELSHSILYGAHDKFASIVPTDSRDITHSFFRSHDIDYRFYEIFCRIHQKWFAVNLSESGKQSLDSFVEQNNKTPDIQTHLSATLNSENPDKIDKLSFTYESQKPIISAIFTAITRYRSEFQNSTSEDPLVIESKVSRQSAGYRENVVDDWFSECRSQLSENSLILLDCLLLFPEHGQQEQQLEEYNRRVCRPISSRHFRRAIANLFKFAAKFNENAGILADLS